MIKKKLSFPDFLKNLKIYHGKIQQIHTKKNNNNKKILIIIQKRLFQFWTFKA